MDSENPLHISEKAMLECMNHWRKQLSDERASLLGEIEKYRARRRMELWRIIDAPSSSSEEKDIAEKKLEELQDLLSFISSLGKKE